MNAAAKINSVRVIVLADSPRRARAVAELLAGDERIELLSPATQTSNADVVIAAGVAADRTPADRNVVFLSDRDPVSFAPQGRAWLPPDVTAAELSAAILAAAQDLTVLTPAQARRRLPAVRQSVSLDESLLEPLTNRELEVLRTLADGLGNKEIATRLGISEHTAKFHVAQILAKLGAASRTEAVTLAIRRGLIPV